MQRLLIVIGLILIPFYEIIFKMFPFIKVVATNTRDTKELMTVGFSLAIFLLAISAGSLKPFRNKYFLYFILFIIFNLFMAPVMDLQINGIDVGDFWFWKPFSQIICLSMLVFAVSSLEEKTDFNFILKIMGICGLVMSIYVILQKLGFDQFWIPKEGGDFTSVTEYKLGGNLGQPTISASFIAMIIPLCLYLKKYIWAIVMAIAVLLTKSDMAIMSLVFILILYLSYTFKIIRIPLFILTIIAALIFSLCLLTNQSFRNNIETRSNGRTNVWCEVYQDIRDGAITGSPQDFSITGVGLGRFSFIFPDKHKSTFHQAHNDLLELTYNCGIIGLVLILISIFHMIWNVFINNLNRMSFSISLGFMTILFCSLFSFPFQLGAHQFYSAILIGLLNNDSIIRRS